MAFNKKTWQREYMREYRKRPKPQAPVVENHDAHVLAWHALPGMVRLEMKSQARRYAINDRRGW